MTDAAALTRIPPRARRSLAATARAVGAFVMAAHGLVHLMGTALLWKVAEPGELTYDDTIPTPGTLPAYVDGALWVVAAAVFVAAAVLVLRRRPAWRPVAAAGAALSTVIVGAPLLAGSTQGGAGVVANVLVGAAVVGAGRRSPRPAA